VRRSMETFTVSIKMIVAGPSSSKQEKCQSKETTTSVLRLTRTHLSFSVDSFQAQEQTKCTKEKC